MSYRYLGYGITDSNGEAKLEYDENGNHLDHSITGTGAGELDIVASLDNPIGSGSLVSETYAILDCYAYDGMTDTDHNDIWQLTNTNMTRTDEGTTFIANGGGQNTVRLKIGDLTNYIPSTSDFVIEFSLKTTSQSTCYLTLQNTDNKTSMEFPTPYNVLNDYRLVYIANDKKVYRYMNGSQTPIAQYNADMGGADVGFKFVDWQSDMNLLVKNFKIYPV